MTDARDNMQKLTPFERELLVRLLRNPFTRLKDLMNRRQIMRLVYTLTPDADNLSRLSLFNALGYIDITDIESLELEGETDYEILRHWQQHPSATYDETASAIMYTYSTVMVRGARLFHQVGCPPVAGRDLARLRLYNHLGWLDRDMMDADIQWLQSPDTSSPLFPRGITLAKRDVLYHLYMNPFASRRDIVELAGCNLSMYDYSVRTVFGTTSRIAIFTTLGYINIGYVTKKQWGSQFDIVSDWKSHPGDSLKTVADRLGISESAINSAVHRMYERNGYDQMPLARSNFKQLAFYWWMHWFDVPRLQSDAQQQYSQF